MSGNIAFVVVNVQQDYHVDVSRKIRKMNGVKEVSVVYGIYDIVVRIEAETMDELKKIVATIKNLDKVRATLALIGCEKLKKERLK